MRFVLAVFLVLVAAAPVMAAGRPMTFDDLLSVKGVNDPQVSPDGTLVAYVVSALDREAGKTNSAIWVVPIEGGTPKQLTTTPGTNNHPRWSPDGKTIAFVSTRGGSSQVWLLPVDGGEPRALTKMPIDVSGPIWSPTGDQIAIAAEVYPNTTPDETAAKDKAKEASKSKARVYDRLMIRHWSSWDEGKRSHIFVVDVKTGAAKDLTPSLDANAPPAPFGGSNDYAFSPDGKEIAFTAEPLKDQAWSTNTDIWTIPTAGGPLKNQTAENPGADAQPSYSPDGKSLAYVSQARPGFESDLWVLKVKNLATGKVTEIEKTMDRPVQSFAWADNAPSFLTSIDDLGTVAIASLPGAKRLVEGGSNTGLSYLPGQPYMVFVHTEVSKPGELYRADKSGGNVKPLTKHNAELVSSLDLNKAERFTFKGADGDEVSGLLLKPPGFDPAKKYPVVFLIHGGPQGAWHDEWHGRWNYQMFAAPGYAVVAINPRGSTGYGQKFTDQISKDWTGRVYEDLMKGLDFALTTYPYLDGDKVAAAGGSYGGFMVNWIAGHSDRFKALISHAGVFDLTSKYGTTEELWFPEWEFGGPPWERPEIYRDNSPSGFVQNFKTPTLVIHGALDFRVPDAQGLGMFTSLQRRGVPSRYLYFPDEGHWIAKPANREVWWREMHAWLDTYLKH